MSVAADRRRLNDRRRCTAASGCRIPRPIPTRARKRPRGSRRGYRREQPTRIAPLRSSRAAPCSISVLIVASFHSSSHSSSSFVIRHSPSLRRVLVLLVEPLLERREVVEHGRRVHLSSSRSTRSSASGHGRVWPIFEHRLESCARLLVVVDRAAVERSRAARLARQRAMELELQDVGQEVAHVRRVRRPTWYFAPGSKNCLAAGRGRRDALVLQAQLPPRLVVVVGRDLAGEDLPAPLVDQQAERQEGDLVERPREQQADVARRGRAPCRAGRSSPGTPA